MHFYDKAGSFTDFEIVPRYVVFKAGEETWNEGQNVSFRSLDDKIAESTIEAHEVLVGVERLTLFPSVMPCLLTAAAFPLLMLPVLCCARGKVLNRSAFVSFILSISPVSSDPQFHGVNAIISPSTLSVSYPPHCGGSPCTPRTFVRHLSPTPCFLLRL